MPCVHDVGFHALVNSDLYILYDVFMPISVRKIGLQFSVLCHFAQFVYHDFIDFITHTGN